jgi:hypothetical protein
MVDEQRTRVEEAMTKMVNEIDKLHLRKMQVIMCLVLEKGFFKAYLIFWGSFTLNYFYVISADS